MREKLKCTTGLVVVGSADDLLRVSKHKKKMEQITQSMVDRCIIVRALRINPLSIFHCIFFARMMFATS